MFQVSQLQQNNWTLEQQLKSSQEEVTLCAVCSQGDDRSVLSMLQLQAVADVVLEKPSGAAARNGSVAATLNVWIRLVISVGTAT